MKGYSRNLIFKNLPIFVYISYVTHSLTYTRTHSLIYPLTHLLPQSYLSLAYLLAYCLNTFASLHTKQIFAQLQFYGATEKLQVIFRDLGVSRDPGRSIITYATRTSTIKNHPKYRIIFTSYFALYQSNYMM